MTTIRRATIGDIAQIIAMAKDMHQESPRYRILGFNANKVGHLALVLIQDSQAGGVLVAEKEAKLVGMLGFHVGKHFFSDDAFASDVVMYLKPENRGSSIFPRLVKAFEAWADEHGVKEKMLGVSAGIDHERTVAVLERMGYARTATGTVKG